MWNRLGCGLISCRSYRVYVAITVSTGLLRGLHVCGAHWKVCHKHPWPLTLCSPSSMIGTTACQPTSTFGTDNGAIQNELNPIIVLHLWTQWHCLELSANIHWIPIVNYSGELPALSLLLIFQLGNLGILNPLRMKTTLYSLLRGRKKSLLYHQIGNKNFFIFITIQWNLMFCVDKIKYEYLAILSNLKSCQFAPRIVIFKLCICCQFEDSQIISPKIIPMSHRNI